MPGRPIPALTPDQMSRIDRIMTGELGVDTLQLMELAVADIGIPPEVYTRVGVAVGPLFAERSIVRVEKS